MATAPLDNLDCCQMSGARARCDPLMRALVDRLDDCYYGTPNPDGTRQANGWRHGVSNPFFIWDYVAGQNNKLKFDLLSGCLHHFTQIVQHIFNCDHGGVNPAVTYAKYDERRYNHVRDSVTGVLVETRVRAAKRWMRGVATTWNNAGLTPVMNRTRFNQIVNYIKNRPAVAELLARRPTIDAVFDIDNETDTA